MAVQQMLPGFSESLVTRKEFAEKMKLSLRSIDRKIADGEFPKGILLGRSRRWRKADIDQWIATGCPKVDR